MIHWYHWDGLIDNLIVESVFDWDLELRGHLQKFKGLGNYCVRSEILGNAKNVENDHLSMHHNCMKASGEFAKYHHYIFKPEASRLGPESTKS